MLSYVAASARRVLGFRSTGLFLASLLSMALNVGAGLLIVRIVTPVEYGKISYFLRIFALARFFGTVGLGAKVIEDVSRCAGERDTDGVNTSVYSLGALRASTGIALLLVLALLSVINRDAIFAWAALTGFLASIFDFIFAIAQGLKAKLLVALATFLQPALLVVLVTAAYFLGRVDPSLVYLSYVASFAGVVAICLVYLRRFVAFPRRAYLSKTYVLRVLPMVLSLFAFGLLNQLYTAISVITLSQFKLFEASAFFNAPFSIITMPAQLGLLLVTAVFYPDLVRLLAARQKHDAAAWIDQFFRGFSVVFALAAGGVAVFADVIVYVLYPEEYTASRLPLIILSPLLVLMLVQPIYNFASFALHKTRKATLVLLVLNILVFAGTLISSAFGQDAILIGIPLAYVLTSGLGVVIMRNIVQHDIPVQVGPFYVALALLIAYLTLGAGRLMAVSIGADSMWMTAISGTLLGLPFFFIVSFVLLLHTDERQSVLRTLHYASNRAKLQ